MDSLVLCYSCYSSKKSLGGGSRILSRGQDPKTLFGFWRRVGLMMLLFFALGRLSDVFGSSWARVCFLREVSPILDRFRKGFGRVLKARNGTKIDISGVLRGMCFEALFLNDVCNFFDQIKGEKHMDF